MYRGNKKGAGNLIATKHFPCILYGGKINFHIGKNQSAIMCLPGARSSIHHPATSPDAMDLACHKGQVPLQ